ncbi:putative baseplate assembly protein [Streptomyces sp. NPDC005374]|uniref:putative baseplate assembly protein n=1 Tax=Streptomyces sp. NPDC005374 TaxID=3364713 RepID=UPI00369276C0
MTLIGPILDDRTYEQLRAELIRRIPVYTSEWTDHNESDPGIVLLDLFAFLGESLLYRFNQIPDATKVAFLRLLDVQPRPAQAAQILVAAETESPGGVQLFVGRELKAGPVSFETGDEMYAWPLEVLGAGKEKAPAPDVRDAYEIARRDEAARRARTSGGATTQVEFYSTTVLPADPATPGAQPLDVNGTLDRALWVALLARPTTDVEQLRGRTVFLGVALDETVDRSFSLADLDAVEAERYRSTSLDQAGPGVMWQLWQPPRNSHVPTNPQLPTTVPFRTLEVVRDSTSGLSRTGVVALTLPSQLPPRPAPRPTAAVTSPPQLDDPEQADRLIGWLRATRTPGTSEGIHRVRWVGVNVVEAVQARTTTGAELLGTGTGEAGQVYRLAQANVLAGTVRLEVEEDGGWRGWDEVEDFTRGAADDRHFSVELAGGLVRFGPGGQQGRVPQIGQRIRVRSYRYGGGAAGNVVAKAVNTVTGIAGVTVANPLPAYGGRDAESLDAALDRIPGEVHRRDRAVVADDFRELALRLPGVARAETLPLFHPDTPEHSAAGVVSVVVFPTEDVRAPGAPLPDHALLRRVAGYLDERKLITTELYVLPPEYVKVSVAVGVSVRDGYQVDAVRRWVELIIRQFLAPVPPYGPDGLGWPLGRMVRGAELEAVAVQVEGVEFLEGDGLRLATRNGVRDDMRDEDTWREVPRVELRRWQVPELADITVVVGEPLEPGTGYRPPSAPSDTVHVPLPREVC